jgi:hypothetical protein
MFNIVYCINNDISNVYSVAQAYLNQKRLDTEAKHLHHNATNFAKQTQQWLQLVSNFSSALKEIGDVENWAKSIEGDMRTVSSSLEYAYKGLYCTSLYMM